MKIKTFKKDKMGTYHSIKGARSFPRSFDEWKAEFENIMEDGTEYRIRMKVELWTMSNESSKKQYCKDCRYYTSRLEVEGYCLIRDHLVVKPNDLVCSFFIEKEILEREGPAQEDFDLEYMSRIGKIYGDD